MTERLTKIGRCNGMKTKVAKTWVMRIARNVIDEKQLHNVEHFNYLGSMITNIARCTREIKCRIVMAKAVFNRKKTMFSRKLGLNLRKKLVKCYIWSTELYSVETWAL
jgi:hypothetical protein